MCCKHMEPRFICLYCITCPVIYKGDTAISLYTVTTGSTILAGDINQLVNVLQRASGQTEAGKYYVTGSSYVSGASNGGYVGSLSRVTTPVSVSIDTADFTPVGANAPATDHLTANGFHVFITSTSVRPDINGGGNYTIQY